MIKKQRMWPWRHGTDSIVVIARRHHNKNDTTCRRVRQTTELLNFDPRTASWALWKDIPKWLLFPSIRCQESVVWLQFDQQQKRFQSDQFPFLALESDGFALVLLLAACVHLHVTSIVYFLDIGFLFYRNAWIFQRKCRKYTSMSRIFFFCEPFTLENDMVLHSWRDTTSPSNFGPMNLLHSSGKWPLV